MKDSFVLYNSFYDPIKSLKNEQLGKLFRSIFNYTINGEITQDNDILVAFMFIKNQIDLDTKKWEDIKQKRSEAGKKHKGNQYTTKWNKMEQNGTNGSVNENVNVNVNDNVNIKETISKDIAKKNFVKPTIDEIKEYCNERNNNVNAEKFYDFYQSKDWYVGKNKMKDWKASVRTWERSNNKKVEDKLPSWFNKQPEERKRSEEDERELQELIRGY